MLKPFLSAKHDPATLEKLEVPSKQAIVQLILVLELSSRSTNLIKLGILAASGLAPTCLWD
jgi:hypothetical protein